LHRTSSDLLLRAAVAVAASVLLLLHRYCWRQPVHRGFCVWTAADLLQRNRRQNIFHCTAAGPQTGGWCRRLLLLLLLLLLFLLLLFLLLLKCSYWRKAW
jgi:hypothetical protein